MRLYLEIRVNVELLTLICSLFVVCAIVNCQHHLQSGIRRILNRRVRIFENDSSRLTILFLLSFKEPILLWKFVESFYLCIILRE